MTTEEKKQLAGKIAELIWTDIPPTVKWQPMSTGDWFDWLENTILIAVGSFETPNDPKLSDRSPEARS